jgi:uncharacterized protein YecE (DUF72 family)
MARTLVGIGGWTFAPWRGAFYPKGLPHAKELDYASRQVTSIEINGTFYGAQRPESFRRWRAEAPDGFVFSVKGPRFATHRRELGESGPSIDRFFASGVGELGDKLGPILWQFPPTTKFDPERFGAFFDLLPKTLDGRALRHVVEVRNLTFADDAFFALLRRYNAAVALVDSVKQPKFDTITADFVYARLKSAADKYETGYPPEALEAWKQSFQTLAVDGAPKEKPRDCFVYFINGAKIRAPAAAMAFIKLLGS